MYIFIYLYIHLSWFAYHMVEMLLRSTISVTSVVSFISFISFTSTSAKPAPPPGGACCRQSEGAYPPELKVCGGATRIEVNRLNRMESYRAESNWIGLNRSTARRLQGVTYGRRRRPKVITKYELIILKLYMYRYVNIFENIYIHEYINTWIYLYSNTNIYKYILEIIEYFENGIA